MASKKTDLATQFGARKKTDPLPPVAPVVPQNALAEVEHALLPETASRSARPTENRVSTRTRQSKQTVGGVVIDEIYQAIRQKKHLASYTLRFRAEELAELESVYNEIEQSAPGALSRNDIARAALLFLLKDYRSRGEQSVLEQIANRG